MKARREAYEERLAMKAKVEARKAAEAREYEPQVRRGGGGGQTPQERMADKKNEEA